MKLTNQIELDDFLLIEDILPVMTKTIGVQVYDFDLRNTFHVKSLHSPPSQPVIARIGAFKDYSKAYQELKEIGIQLIHSPAEHEHCSFLPKWYPIIADLTPKSVVYDSLPTAETIENEFNWPIFVKGERQTNKHKKSLSIIENPSQFEKLLIEWKGNKMLHWQKMVCREFVPLKLVELPTGDRLPSSYEFRLFYWKQHLVGVGRYWYEGTDYQLSTKEQKEIEQLGSEVANRLIIPFITVDIAKTKSGNWIVIEVNDGQESGYAGNYPKTIWENIVKIEKTKRS